MGFGDYPVEYNPKVHGPYDPARFYGKHNRTSFRTICRFTRYNFLMQEFVQKIVSCKAAFTADTPFRQVKLGELGSWIGRRNKSPQGVVAACSRAWWRWQHKYVQPSRAGIAPFFQITAAAMTFFYLINYGKITRHRNYKYHW